MTPARLYRCTDRCVSQQVGWGRGGGARKEEDLKFWKHERSFLNLHFPWKSIKKIPGQLWCVCSLKHWGSDEPFGCRRILGQPVHFWWQHSSACTKVYFLLISGFLPDFIIDKAETVKSDRRVQGVSLLKQVGTANKIFTRGKTACLGICNRPSYIPSLLGMLQVRLMVKFCFHW